MPLARSAITIATAALLAMGLAGCSSLGVSSPTSTARGLDYLNDDLGAMALAFDMPVTLEPVPDGSRLSFSVSVPEAGDRTVEAVLVPGDASEVMDTLPPPAEGRTYYVFALKPDDATKLRKAQAWARTQASAGKVPKTPVIGITPGFCRSAAIDPATTMVSVRLVVPERQVSTPLVENQSLAAVLAATGGGTLPPCAGHSG